MWPFGWLEYFHVVWGYLLKRSKSYFENTLLLFDTLALIFKSCNL